ncbi:MAG: diphosphate--fructose-6-phosphate 1-phosphotransferase [Spirochaetaceae bacterium]|nr:MAG: diphosphate--fructose-6-phosphate 1-phosphotransferase [Spirochaetaceae bacterium]
MGKGNAVVGQSGGPTSVINSSLAGVIEAAAASSAVDRIYGMRFAIEGLMEDRLVDLSEKPKGILEKLKHTPSSALGSSRHKIQEQDLPKILDVLKKHDIRYFFLIGGNDTMDTIHRVEQHCRQQGYELFGVGIPKTVDNDLFGTDHTPGFPSAARCNILNVLQAGILARDMQRVDRYVIYQSIGRDAGWLSAATAAARRQEAEAPHLIYLPEVAFEKERFLADVEKCITRYGWVSIVCGEGLQYADGTPVSASQTTDKFGNIEFGAMAGASVALNLHRMIMDRFDFRGEFQITESLIMSAMDRSVDLDLQEAYDCGRKAVELATGDTSGVMVTIARTSNAPYRAAYQTAPLSEVAEKSKPMPREYINSDGNFVTDEFYEYIRPLVGDIPEFAVL